MAGPVAQKCERALAGAPPLQLVMIRASAYGNDDGILVPSDRECTFHASVRHNEFAAQWPRAALLKDVDASEAGAEVVSLDKEPNSPFRSPARFYCRIHRRDGHIGDEWRGVTDIYKGFRAVFLCGAPALLMNNPETDRDAGALRNHDL